MDGLGLHKVSIVLSLGCSCSNAKSGDGTYAHFEPKSSATWGPGDSVAHVWLQISLPAGTAISMGNYRSLRGIGTSVPIPRPRALDRLEEPTKIASELRARLGLHVSSSLGHTPT
jgi:hypothetical protein